MAGLLRRAARSGSLEGKIGVFIRLVMNTTAWRSHHLWK